MSPKSETKVKTKSKTKERKKELTLDHIYKLHGFEDSHQQDSKPSWLQRLRGAFLTHIMPFVNFISLL